MGIGGGAVVWSVVEGDDVDECGDARLRLETGIFEGGTFAPDFGGIVVPVDVDVDDDDGALIIVVVVVADDDAVGVIVG